MHARATTTGQQTQINNTLRAFAEAQPDPLRQALSMIRRLAAAHDGSRDTAQAALLEIEDPAGAATDFVSPSPLPNAQN